MLRLLSKDGTACIRWFINQGKRLSRMESRMPLVKGNRLYLRRGIQKRSDVLSYKVDELFPLLSAILLVTRIDPEQLAEHRGVNVRATSVSSLHRSWNSYRLILWCTCEHQARDYQVSANISTRSVHKKFCETKKYLFLNDQLLLDCVSFRGDAKWSLSFETLSRHFYIKSERISVLKDAYVYIAQRIADVSSKLCFYPALYAFFLPERSHTLSLPLPLPLSLSYMCFTCKCKKSPVGIAAFEHASFHSPRSVFRSSIAIMLQNIFRVKRRLFPSLYQRDAATE